MCISCNLVGQLILLTTFLFLVFFNTAFPMIQPPCPTHVPSCPHPTFSHFFIVIFWWCTKSGFWCRLECCSVLCRKPQLLWVPGCRAITPPDSISRHLFPSFGSLLLSTTSAVPKSLGAWRGLTLNTKHKTVTCSQHSVKLWVCSLITANC